MQTRLALIFSFILCLFEGNAQQTPSEITYKTWDIHALRYYPFEQPADSFMQQVIGRKAIPYKEIFTNQYEKTAVDLTMNIQYLVDGIERSAESGSFLFKYVLLPYTAWLNYGRLIREDSPDLNLTIFLSERYLKGNKQTHFSIQSPLEWVGTENIQYYLEEWLGKFDLQKDRNKVLFSSIKSPLAKDAGKTYNYFFSSQTKIDSIPVYEIVFFSQNPVEKAFEGYLYISESDLSLVKAVFTLNPSVKKSLAKSVLFTQTPSKKETQLTVGDEMSTGLLIEQTRIGKKNPQDSIPSDLLTPAQKAIPGLIEKAHNTRAYSNLQEGIILLYTDRIGIFHNNFDLGPITQMLSYNFMEGLRMRVGGLTSQKLNDQLAASGYLAFGTKDRRWKYRGDIIFSPRLKGQIRFTYVNDLNIPGYDCLEDKRDRFYYSLNQANTANMSLQKIGQLSCETNEFLPFSLKLNAKYTYDQPLGIVNYETVNNGVHTTINNITTTEIGVSFRFSPTEKHLRVKGKRLVFRSSEMDFSLNHRIGIKGIFGSDFNYQITDASAFKSFKFPLSKGSFDVRLSGGKVWNAVPFPLLFIPEGNQSYVFENDNYNLMRFYEFTTDRFVAGNVNLHLNWSPVQLFSPKSKLKTHWGIKAIYGPLSEKNDPLSHPELFVFNHGVEALGEKPYAETHIGLSGILKYFRIDYVYRLTYRNNYRNAGSFFVSTAINL